MTTFRERKIKHDIRKQHTKFHQKILKTDKAIKVLSYEKKPYFIGYFPCFFLISKIFTNSLLFFLSTVIVKANYFSSHHA